MKKVFYMLMIVMVFIFLQGCGSIRLSEKEVRIELGSEAPEEIWDYVSVEDKYREEFEQKAFLDLSGVDVYTVGEYQAIVAYEGQEVVIPVIVEDTTPPEIWLKDVSFKEGDEVQDSEMVYIRDMSDVNIKVGVDGSHRETFIAYPGMILEVEATDAYGNRAMKEVVPYVREMEEKGIAGGSRIISSRYAEKMYYANDETYLALREAYGKVEWESQFETGDLKTYGSYREKFKELVEDKKPFYDKKTGKWIYLGEYRERDQGFYGYYFFDMNNDGEPELGVKNGRVISFFKYDEDKDQFFLWGEWNDYKINGSGVLRHEEFSSGSYERYYFCRLDEKGNEICTVWFRVWLYLDKEIEEEICKKEVYIMTFPKYVDQENEIPEDIKKQGYNYYGTYIFRVTEEQYHELTEGYFVAEDVAEDREMDVFYSHDELWGE